MPETEKKAIPMSSGRRDHERGRAYHDDRSRHRQHGQRSPRRKRSRSPSRDDSVWGRDRRQWGRPSRSEDHGCSGDSVWGSHSRSYGARGALPYASQAVQQHRSRPVAVPRQHQNLQLYYPLLQHYNQQGQRANGQQGGDGVSATPAPPPPLQQACSHPPSLRGAHPHIHSCHAHHLIRTHRVCTSHVRTSTPPVARVDPSEL